MKKLSYWGIYLYKYGINIFFVKLNNKVAILSKNQFLLLKYIQKFTNISNLDYILLLFFLMNFIISFFILFLSKKF